MDDIFTNYAQLPEVSWLDAFFLKRYNGIGASGCRTNANSNGEYIYWTNEIVTDTIYINPQDSSQTRYEQRKNLYVDDKAGYGTPCSYNNYVESVLKYNINQCNCK